jgi:FixJ family two-component response regulator
VPIRPGSPMHNTVVIAVVDDDEAIRSALNSLLRASGYRVQTYCSARAFLESTDLDQVHCLISDIQMPGMSGLQLLEALHAQGWRIPVMFVTAHPDDVNTRVPGVVACLPKPFQVDDLLKHIDIALNRTKPV